MDEEVNQSNPGQPGSSDGFFEAMDREVNGAIIDEDQPVQETLQSSGPIMETHNVSEGSNQNNSVDWEKRYKDSSREATKMAGQLNALKPFVPLLRAMKQDSGLVNTVKDYLTNGGKPAKSIKERLGLDGDFVFDQEEAFNDSNSDSAKLLNSHVDSIVAGRVKQMMDTQQKQANINRTKAMQMQEAAAFKKKHNMSDEEFAAMIEKAKTKRVTLDDMAYVLNRDQANKNVAESTRNDMVNQMKNVRNIPTTASGVNSPRAEQSQDDNVFDDILGSDKGISELFG